MKKAFLTAALFMTAFFALQAQSVTGVWRSVDDENGESKSHIQLWEADGKLYGKIVKTLRKNAPTLCEKCPAERKNQPLVGMIIVVNLFQKDGMWQGGQILDPEKGKWYGCKLWLKQGDPNTLMVRGSIGPFYRTQTWYKVN